MFTERDNVLADLRRLAEELGNSKVVSSGRTHEKDTDGTKPSLPEINKWIEAIKLKVRNQLFLNVTFPVFNPYFIFRQESQLREELS